MSSLKSSIFAIKACNYAFALKLMSDYQTRVTQAANIQFEGMPEDGVDRIVINTPNVVEAVRAQYKNAGFYTRIRLSIPEEVTLLNMDNFALEVFLSDDSQKLVEYHVTPVTNLPRELSLALETELYHMLLSDKGINICTM